MKPIDESTSRSPKYEGFNPAEHAETIIAACHGDFSAALECAHINAEVSKEEDKDYWDRVAIAIQGLSGDLAFQIARVFHAKLHQPETKWSFEECCWWPCSLVQKTSGPLSGATVVPGEGRTNV